MEPSTLYERPPVAPKPSKIWILITIVAGAVGALGAIAAAGKGTYEITPFTVELSARPAPAGKTELAVAPSDPDLAKLTPDGHAEAGTHAGPIAFRASITGLTPGARLASSDAVVYTDPEAAIGFIRQDGRDAVRAFAIKLALLALSGGAAAGVVIGARRFRRIFGAALAGLVCVGVIGTIAQQTYDETEFAKTRYVFEPTDGAPVDVLPSL